jgi:hypothetical protein
MKEGGEAMAKKIDVSFNFGANVKRKRRAAKGRARAGKGGKKASAWRSYTGGR